MITSPLRSRWQAHGELRIALTSGPCHESLLNVKLVLRMVLRIKSSSCRLVCSCCLKSVLVAHRSPSSSSTPSSLPSPTWQRERLRAPSTTSAKSSGRSRCRLMLCGLKVDIKVILRFTRDETSDPVIFNPNFRLAPGVGGVDTQKSCQEVISRIGHRQLHASTVASDLGGRAGPALATVASCSRSGTRGSVQGRAACAAAPSTPAG